jgi:hypothetical protein
VERDVEDRLMAGLRASGEVFVVVYDSKITAMNAPSGMVYRYADHKAEAVLVAAKAFAPKRTGRLAGGIRKDVRQTSRDRVVGRVRSTARHSQWVHGGTTGPITPKNGPYMRVPAFIGAAYRVNRVAVRGQAANPFLDEALAVGMRASFPTPVGPANPFL